ncbi:MAG: Gfo/Idh/MocA family oxidoreductase [Verrucomicrobia bacterium]|nr:Gfo/Idh/MocA family oxidoreductase [Verrucomicrobiota bacterium]
MRQEIKFGVIGTSHRGQGLIRQYLKLKECKITALCDCYERLVKQAHDIIGDGNVRCYTDHRRMLREADIDAVCVFTEPERNVPTSCDALAAGKHVLCEVPLCYNIEDCWRMVLAVEKSGLKFQLAEQVRFHPCMQAWKQMVDDGRLGHVLFVRGEYLHPLPEDWFWVDAKTGEKIPLAKAKRHPHKRKGRVWTLEHPIWYLPHELSPLLRVLDDRVVTVACMATRKRSYVYPWFPHADIEVATMRTRKDTVLNLAAGFTAPNYPKIGYGYHWYQMMGSKGSVETPRSNRDKSKMWFADSFMNDPAEATWEFNQYKTPLEALQSGHGGVDYWPMATFIESIIKDTTPAMDVYQSAESAAPAIMAGLSVEQACRCLEVPDFRPNARRKSGVAPNR